MADPFEALRSMPVTPVDPNPAFAARLRSRIERALARPQGVAMPTATAEPTTTQAVLGAVTPYLAVKDTRAAVEWYVDVFAARVRQAPYELPDGRIGHAELEISGSVVMLADEFPELGVGAPQPGQSASVSLRLEVRDVDATTSYAEAAGAAVERPPSDSPYGRGATIRDPFGHRWLLAALPTAATRLPNRTREGDLSYVSFEVPDLERAMAFYGQVVGWRFNPGAWSEQQRQVDDVAPGIGLVGGQPRAEPIPTWRVDDMEAAIQRVRAAGGSAEQPRSTPYGTTASGTDDQGTRFYLWQPTAEQVAAERDVQQRDVNGSRQGDIAYVTLEVVDSQKARAFYGAVLGWRFTPGRIQDGWNVEGTMPMMGMSGGHEQATVVLMYRVDDVQQAVERSRALGGSSSEPHQEPYGTTAECTDDQGGRFYLGQF